MQTTLDVVVRDKGSDELITVPASATDVGPDTCGADEPILPRRVMTFRASQTMRARVAGK